MGAANYKVPIALPPGIKDVAPQVALTYSSSGNNGIAGYGWNIVGISSITRTSTRIDVDGYVDGVDFDANDQYALDGQRLMKDGRSTGDDIIYYTENYSNLRIRAIGTATYPGASGSGPEKFEITFPDGTQAFYGSTANSRGVSEWLIDKWIDPQGNTIEYEYVSNSNVTYIRFIRWSKNANIGTNGYENLMEFVYKNRTRPEKAYLHGIAMTNNWLLDRIEVKTGGNLFRKYQLTHVNNSLNYQNVSQIQEFNGANEAANPIVFGYEETDDIRTQNDKIFADLDDFDITNVNIKYNGDFDGDGRLDVVTPGKLYLNLYQQDGVQSIQASTNGGSLRGAVISALEGANGKMLQQQAILGLTEDTFSIGDTVSYTGINNILELGINKLNTTDYQFNKIYSKEFIYPYFNHLEIQGCQNPNTGNYFHGNIYDGSGGKQTIEGDFNGDGLSDVLLIGSYTKKIYSPQGYSQDPYPCFYQYTEVMRAPTYFIDLNPNIPVSQSYGVVLDIEHNANNEYHTIDFNGDGRSDLMIINKSNGNYSIYTYANDNLDIAKFNKIHEGTSEYRNIGTSTDYQETDVLIFGDYNGDGKTDFVVPTAVNSDIWRLYTSTGSSYSPQNVNLGAFTRFRSLYDNRQQYLWRYEAIDADNDGKTDIVSYYTAFRYSDNPNGPNFSWARYNFHLRRNMTDVNGNTWFEEKFPTGIEVDMPNAKKPGFGFVTKFRNNQSDSELLITWPTNDNKAMIRIIDFKKDQSKEMRLKSVGEANGNIVSELTYNALEPNAANGGLGDVNGVYHSSNVETFPYIEIKRLSNVNVVTKLKVSAMGKTKEREFKYFGLTSHSHGLGILGFKIMAQSSWITAGIDTKIWQVSHTAPSLRGAPIGSWSFSGNNLSLITNPVDNQLLSKNTLWYTVQNLTNNRYVQLPYQQVENDFLTGVTTTTNSEFDSYWNLKKSTVQKGGTYITEYTYANNAGGTGVNYYIGRLTKKGTIAYAYGDERTSEEKYTYTGNQLTKVETKGHNTDYLTEIIQYDGYGNVTQKTTSAPGVSSRTIKDEYETTGRFVKKKTDVDGLITELTYNNLGQVLTQKDPFNVTTTSAYDHWGKLTSVVVSGASTTPMSTYYQYERFGSGAWHVISDNANTREYSVSSYDVLGRNTINTTKGFAANTYIAKQTDYDFLGRVTRTSEPSASQWNTIEYDHLSRPIKQTAFTGKVTNISYNGLSATTTENGKTKTVTKDAAGNVISVSDNGQVLNYNYYANNALKSTTYGNHIVSIGIDGWGRKISLLDPSISSTAYAYNYNNYGELLEETTPNGTTNYSYSPTGKLETKEILGDNTNIFVEYFYTNKGLLESEHGTSNGESQSFVYEYDTLYRLKKRTETTDLPLTLTLVKEFIYDDYSRISEEWASTSVWSTMTTNLTSAISVKNHYNTFNGILEHITDKASGATIWKLTGANQRMQTLSAQLGNGVNIANTYTNHGYVNTINHTKTGLTAPLSLSYTFDAAKGTLTNRTNNFYSYTENFTYDNFDRLLSWTTPTGVETNTYEGDGRIKTNTNVGTYNYNTGTRYKKSGISLNTAGNTYYNGRQLQQVTYNAFKKPVLISEQGRGSIEFKYGITGVRNKAIEWITDAPNTGANKLFRTKLYSSDGSVEIVLKGGASAIGLPATTNIARIITYIGGNAYSAPAMFVTDYQTATSKSEGYHYLHRDFQGSIMAVTNATTVLERRHYDAWGNVSRFNASTNPNLIGGEFFLDRGYTGHEHFFRVGIIHMNGRIYDSVLKGFVSPDNFVQDPQNSQNFNRYAYCYNNPLMHTDPSGEWIFESTLLSAVIIGAIIGGVSYGIMTAASGLKFKPLNLLKSVVIGAVSGAVSFGVGELASAAFPAIAQGTATTMQHIGYAAMQAGGHGISQGLITGITGGNAEQALITGMISSVVSSAVTGINSAINLDGTAGDVSTMLFGSVSGGLSAELTGGNFWQGAATGLIVSGLNHGMHKMSKPFEFKDDTVEDLVSKLQQEKKGTVLTGKEIKTKYGIKQNVQRAISEVKVLGGGKYDVTWNNKMLINSGTVLSVKDGELTVKSSSISNKNGYTLSGSAISAVIDDVKFPKLFLDGNYIYGVKKNNSLTTGYGF